MKTVYRQARASHAGVVFLSPGGVRYRYSDRSDATRQVFGYVLDENDNKIPGSYTEIPKGSILERKA